MPITVLGYNFSMEDCAYRKLVTQSRKIFRDAILKGQIEPQRCIQCDTYKAGGHHPDYRKPLEVIWLCAKHHGIQHQGNKRERQFLGQYPICTEEDAKAAKELRARLDAEKDLERETYEITMIF
jgi:hypothetical protein